jgi:hypothetical protein
MSFARTTPVLFVLFALSLLPFGCSSGNKAGDDLQRRKNDLGQFFEIYMQYVKANQRPPKQLSDLQRYQTIDPVPLKVVQNGDYIVVWGLDLGKDSGAVLAYEKDAPKQGGAVLLADGTVTTMTAEKLQAALKAKG